ncbi:serine-threonine protein kinase, plant-type, putative [Ricinus communis]|uniref:Serine-threonine protein kinase, plant-type, putative n=1 Tax=Ricinus communis TaxID=3988 RepID=B9R7P0_RICCO|nr:serine-threonine protein kinase, plant-type, putative [Ricinus communis]|eukprot:XP_002510333.1 lysM domain receptor-like kinase 4 [Ricinus communis]
MDQFLLSLLTLGLFISFTYAQQNYSANSALDCNSSDETGPSPAFLYTCNGQNRTCQAFLIFRSRPPYDSAPTISALTSASQEELARFNNVTGLSEFPLNKEVIVPVSCSCLGQYYQANTSFQVASDHSYFTIASQTYEGLSTCASLKKANIYGEFDLALGAELQVPLRCACPTASQVRNETKYLLTFPISESDHIAAIAERFNVSKESIIDANGLRESPTIYPDTTILIPLTTEPSNSQTIIHENPTEVSPPLASPPDNRRSKRKLYEKVGITAACSLLVLSIIVVILFLLRKDRRHKFPEINRRREQEDLRLEIASVEQVLKVFGLEEVKKATDNFSSKHIIKGSLYWGEFNGQILAIKKMNRDVSKEVNILKRINHFNLIKLHGVCENLGCFYLFFEYMKNGSLQEWLSRERFEDVGSWNQRIQIALDIANGLFYLHSFTEPACVHKDITSGHILLDNNLRAKIANFSLARAAANAVLTKHIEGTRGYMAPEYVQAGQVTPKIDVYAFGIVLLELITGKDAVFMRDGKETLLSKAIFSVMEKENAEAELAFVIDPSFTGGRQSKLALRLARVSLACLTQVPARRPSMGEVVSTLVKIQTELAKSESLNVNSIDVAVPVWCSSIGENDWRAEAISK